MLMQIIVQDLMTHYDRQGSGKTILLLHGWADRLETFSGLTKELSQHYDVVAVDLPGFGQTQAPPVVWNLDNYGQFVVDFLKKLNVVELYAVIGHSNGGAMAIRALVTGNLQAERLVLLAASGVRDGAKLRRGLLKLIAKTGKATTFWLPLRHKQKLQKKLYGTVGSDMLVAPMLQETFKQTVRQDIQADAGRLQLPTLLIYGEKDTATPVGSIAKQFNLLIANSRLEIISGADHFVHHAEPKKVNNLIAEFLT